MSPIPQPRVTLVSVSDAVVTDSGLFFRARFKAGVFGKPVGRTFWAKASDDGATVWDRVSPDDLRQLVGADMTGEVSIAAVEIEPEEFVNDKTGEVHTVSSRSVVRFSDETLDQATRRSGSRMRSGSAAQALAIHGDGYDNGGDLVPQIAA